MVTSGYRGRLPGRDWLSRVDVEVLTVEGRAAVMIHQTVGLNLADCRSVEGLLFDVSAHHGVGRNIIVLGGGEQVVIGVTAVHRVNITNNGRIHRVLLRAHRLHLASVL